LAWNSIRWRAAFLTTALVAVVLASFIGLTVRLVSDDVVRRAIARSEAAVTQLATQVGSQTGPQSGSQPASQVSRRFQDFAGAPEVQAFLESAKETAKPGALAALERLATGGRQAAALWDAKGRLVLTAGPESSAPFADEPAPATMGPGPLREYEGRVYLRIYGVVHDSSGKLVLGHFATSRVIDAATSGQMIGSLAGQDARVFIGNQAGDVWTDLRRAVTLRSLDLNSPTSRDFLGPDGERMIGALAKVPNTPWVFVFAFPRSEVMQPVWRLVRSLTAMGTVFLLLVTAGAVVLSARVTRPLGELTDAAQAMTAGDYTQRVRTTGRDEIALLGETFNEMALQVERARADLETRARELAASREDARRANQAKDEFLAVLSHELRSPLNAMLGWCQLLRQGAVPAHRVPHAIDVIERNARAQLRLVDDLLDVSRIVVGRFFVDFHPVDAAAIVQAAIEAIQPAAVEKGVQIHANLAADVGPLRGDAGRLQQAVGNLLSNALKFTPADGLIIVSLTPADDGVEILVRDTGDGISPDILPYIFDRLRQDTERSSRQQQAGLGLGLAIVRQVIELHGGTVTAESAGKGGGATFRIRLPRTDIATADVPREQTPAVSAPGSAINTDVYGPTVRGIRCLIVDDSEDAREMVAALLSTRGADVLTAESVDAALATLERQLPDVIVSDLSMPGRSGLDLIERVRSRPADQGGRIPAVALTAYAGPEDRRRSILAGFDVHLVKPVDAAELIETVTRLVRT